MLHHYLTNVWVDSSEILERIKELEKEEEEEEAK